jgi:hypothetical protein
MNRPAGVNTPSLKAQAAAAVCTASLAAEWRCFEESIITGQDISSADAARRQRGLVTAVPQGTSICKSEPADNGIVVLHFGLGLVRQPQNISLASCVGVAFPMDSLIAEKQLASPDVDHRPAQGECK